MVESFEPNIVKSAPVALMFPIGSDIVISIFLTPVVLAEIGIGGITSTPVVEVKFARLCLRATVWIPTAPSCKSPVLAVFNSYLTTNVSSVLMAWWVNFKVTVSFKNPRVPAPDITIFAALGVVPLVAPVTTTPLTSQFDSFKVPLTAVANVTSVVVVLLWIAVNNGTVACASWEVNADPPMSKAAIAISEKVNFDNNTMKNLVMKQL